MLRSFLLPYSPKCLEYKFCEVHLQDAALKLLQPPETKPEGGDL